jgi:NADH-ubiquinone oxidoreductase chain 5
MYILTLLLPLFSFCVLGLFGRFIGGLGATLFSTTLIGTSALLACLSFYEVALSGSVVRLQLSDWFSLGPLMQSWGFLFDAVTVSMLVVVLTISFFVHLYSSSYMSSDPYLVRFMSYLSLFTFFMLCLVTADNYAQMFLGWEGVGLSSYLLINFWFTRLAANKSAIKAVIVNRFGDFALVVGLLAVYCVFRSFDYGVMFALAPSLQTYYFTVYVWEIHALSFLSFFLLVGCVGKSAQMGLHTWLPDAMEGPTPVSALIHAATMVTAGVFLLTRFAPILELSPTVLGLVTLVGAFTAFFAGTVGIFQNDLKRVIAYSTCSQLGYMVLACGLSNYSLALFHLLNHAFFKALLFLSAGSVIHALSDEQDMRRMGGLLKLLPFTYTCFLVGSLALMGFPYTSGFYSKDFILEVAYGLSFSTSFVAYICGLLAALCTAFYSFRLVYLVFVAESNLVRPSLQYVHEPDFRMTLPLFALVFFSIFTGYLLKDAFVGMGTPFLSASLHEINLRYDYASTRSEFIFASEKSIPVFFSVLSASLACYIYANFPRAVQVASLDALQGRLLSGFKFFNKKWYYDQVYNSYIVYPLLRLGHTYTFKTLDRGVIEFLGPTGLVRFWLQASGLISRWQSGYIFNYVFSMVIALVFMLLWVRIFAAPATLALFSALFCAAYFLQDSARLSTPHLKV